MEKIIKTKLVNILKNDFQIIENLVGISFDGKEVRPDLGLKMNNLLFVVEIKDDTAKNFDLAQLLRQSINYKYSKYNGIIPTYCFITTTLLLKLSTLSHQDDTMDIAVQNGRMMGLANKLGIGTIKYRKSENSVQVQIGSRILYKRNILTQESEFDFVNLVHLKIGTNSKSNRITQ